LSAPGPVKPSPFSLQKLRRWREARGPVLVPGRKRPANLIYDVDDVPPTSVQIAAAFQHIFVLSVGWIYVVMVVNAIGGTSAQMQSLIRMSMIGSGIATIVQSRRGWGNGYLCPLTCSLTYLGPLVLAGRAGGFSLMFGMVLVAGIAAMLMSRVVYRLRFLFPPEVTGLMVAMSGLQLVALGCPRFLGYSSPTSVADPRALLVGVITLLAMIVPTIWNLGKLHLFPMLLGVAAGYAAAFALGELRSAQLLAQMPPAFVSFPERASSGLTFSLLLLPPFLIAALTATLKTVGDTTLCQKANDADWKRSDMQSVSGGVLTNGLGTAVSGLLGGIAQNTTSSSIGLSLATGTTSRAIALPLGLLVIGLAFFPRLATLVAAMPGPAVGAVLIYSACFIVLGGLQLLTSRMLDARRIFAVGISLIFGLSIEIAPDLYRPVPAFLHPVFSSSTSLTTVLVVILSLFFRIGLKKQRSLELRAGEDSLDAITHFMDEQGSAWGMRKEVVARATDAAYEVVNNLRLLPLRSDLITLRTVWDELRLDLEIEYDGPPIELAESMPALEEMGTQSGVAHLAGYLIRQYADRVRIREKNGVCRVQLHFDH
jgi:xanthine permease XanP